jgi:hypothetical protein
MATPSLWSQEDPSGAVARVFAWEKVWRRVRKAATAEITPER